MLILDTFLVYELLYFSLYLYFYRLNLLILCRLFDDDLNIFLADRLFDENAKLFGEFMFIFCVCVNVNVVFAVILGYDVTFFIYFFLNVYIIKKKQFKCLNFFIALFT